MDFILYLLGFIIIISASIYLFIISSVKKNIKWFSAPSSEGKFVDSHGKRIFYRVKGKGEPVVVVLGSIGSSQAEWWPIQNEVGMKFRMLTFDRAGYGWSSAQDNTRSASNISDDLDIILKFERIKKPIFLVAHGSGTIYARHYAITRPQNVQGVLFIDPLPLRYSQWINCMNDIEECHNPFEMTLKNKKKASLGLFRILSPLKGYKLDKRYKRDIIEHYTKSENYENMQSEMSQIQNSISEIDSSGEFPPIPLKVLYPANEALIREWIRNGIPEYSARQMGRLHHEFSHDIMKLSPKSTLLEIEGSGEYIHLSKPDIVVREIIKMLDE